MIKEADRLKRIEGIIVPPDTSVAESLERMDRSGIGILLICAPEKKLVGVLTDGDVRRYLLHNRSLNAPVSDLMNRNFISVPEAEKDTTHHLLEKSKINHVPILDIQGRIVDLVTALDFIKKENHFYDNPVIIMAGGKGDRLSPLTKIIPKPLIPVGDQTMIELIMDNFRNNSFHNFYIIVNYKKELIKAYFEENNLSKKVAFIEEQEYLGTAGGLSLIKGLFNKTIILSNCDIIAKLDYSLMLDWHKDHDADLTILGVRRKIDVPYGIIKTNSDNNYVTSIDEKPNFSFMIISGIYLLEPSLIDSIPDNNTLGMDNFIEQTIASGKKVTCYPTENGWFDIGQFDEYKNLLKHFGGLSV